ncbi:MAG: hypothetical protein NVS2B16_17760 [Chloroflexota bacterium]
MRSVPPAGASWSRYRKQRPAACVPSAKDESSRGRWAQRLTFIARDKFVYILKGQVVLRIGEESRTVEAGTFAFVPRDTVHGFHNASSDSATLLVMHHPSGFERFLEEAQQLDARHGDRAEWSALAARFDMIPVPPTPEI